MKTLEEKLNGFCNFVGVPYEDAPPFKYMSDKDIEDSKNNRYIVSYVCKDCEKEKLYPEKALTLIKEAKEKIRNKMLKEKRNKTDSNVK